MYLRFTVPKGHGGAVTRARVAPGPFAIASRLWWTGDSENDPILIALRYELDWFNEWLPVPHRFGVVAKGRHWSDGICWFRDNAREMVGHAYALTALIEECGVPIVRSWTRDPGQILYRDPFQVVAKPERSCWSAESARPGGPQRGSPGHSCPGPGLIRGRPAPEAKQTKGGSHAEISRLRQPALLSSGPASGVRVSRARRA